MKAANSLALTLEGERAALRSQLDTLTHTHTAACENVRELTEKLRVEREAGVSLRHEWEMRERDLVGDASSRVQSQELALSAAKAEAAMILQAKQAKEHELNIAQVGGVCE